MRVWMIDVEGYLSFMVTFSLAYHPVKFINRYRYGEILFERYQEAKLAAGLKRKTLKDYKTIFMAYSSWAVENFGPRHTPDKKMFERYLAYLRTTGISEFRRRNVLIALKSFYKWVEAEGIRDNPVKDIPLPKTPQKIIDIYEPREIKAVFKVINDRCQPANAFRNLLMYRLLLQTGLREAEVVNLELRDVDIESRQITVRHAKMDKEGIVPLPGCLVGDMTKYLNKRVDNQADKRIFPIRPDSVWTLWDRMCKRAGVRNRGIHAMRHTWACSMLMGDPKKSFKPISPISLMHLGRWASLDMVSHYAAFVAKKIAIRDYHESGR